MKLSLAAADATLRRADLLVIPVIEGGGVAAPGLERKLRQKLESLRASADFAGKDGKTVSLPAPTGFGKTLLFVGIGGKHRDILEASRRVAGIGLGKASELSAHRIVIIPPSDSSDSAVAAAEGLLLADYKFDRYKSAPKPKRPVEVVVGLAIGDAARKALKSELSRLESIVAGVQLARNVSNEPANVMTPSRLAEEAQQIAKDRKADGVTCKILGPAELKKLGMGAYLAVGWGSEQEPRFIHLTYKPKGKGSGKRVALVGKGLCFDSGGISIKPAGGMEDMKFDMCGAAAVLGVFRCLPELGITHEVHGFVAATENMPGGAAVRPGDIVTSMTGKTIEVINTDAEGRLTLVDAISYAVREKPDVIVDLATLTGACAVALGSASGIMSNDDALREALCKSSDATGERAWPLPLFEDYKSQLKSEHADVKNLGDRYGGALTAGLFIQEWVPQGLPWAHMDIAGSAWTDRELPYSGKGATGIGVRTLAHWLRTSV